MLMAVNGVLVNLYPHSGHYRPTDRHLHRLLLFLSGLGVDLSAIQVDAQRVHKVARPDKKVRLSWCLPADVWFPPPLSPVGPDR